VACWGLVDVLVKIALLPFNFLTQYYCRNLSKEWFIVLIRAGFGRTVRQRLDDRVNTAMFSITLFHIIYSVRTNPK
jgi:transposase